MNIKIENVSYSYTNSLKTNLALDNISFEIKDQDFLAIVGHTGSGKSTLIQNLNALLIPTSGKVIVDEFSIAKKIKLKNIKQLRKKIGMVFQFPEYQLFKETVRKDILFGPSNFFKELKNEDELALSSLELVGLDKSYLDKSPFELSGGEKRRVAIAGILAFNPDVLIVDEPTAGLDPLASENMMKLFKKLHDEEKKTIILVTHQMNDVLKYANRLIILKDGKLICDDNPYNVFKNIDVNDYSLDVPDVFKVVKQLNSKYPQLNNYKITDIDSLVLALKDVIKHD